MEVRRSMKELEIELEPEKVLKSQWKEEVKRKISTWNEKEIRERCREMRKGRTVCEGKWGRKEYLKLDMGEVREILKMRLHMMPLPCNYGESGKGCSLCNSPEKIETEHYLHCIGTEYIRKKWGLKEEVKIDTDDIEEERKISKYMRQICSLLGTGKMEKTL